MLHIAGEEKAWHTTWTANAGRLRVDFIKLGPVGTAPSGQSDCMRASWTHCIELLVLEWIQDKPGTAAVIYGSALAGLSFLALPDGQVYRVVIGVLGRDEEDNNCARIFATTMESAMFFQAVALENRHTMRRFEPVRPDIR